MINRLVIASCVLLLRLSSFAGGAELDSGKTSTTTADFQSIRNQVETLRGKTFKQEVPVTDISEQEMREMCDRELEKQYPGQNLTNYEELLAWFDMLPPNTDLKSVYATFMIDQVAGLYDSDTKKMRIPSFTVENTNHVKPDQKQLEKLGSGLDNIVLAHEFTHALEDQYWAIDDPKDDDESGSTDRGTAHSFLLEGSATRAMAEAVPAQSSGRSAGTYFLMWNLLHSGLGEFVLKYALLDAWKSSDSLVEGVPETLSRTEALPYSFGYVFCADILRNWGLDGLDYIYDHRPISSEQIMHPAKAWEWRDFPVQVTVPKTLPGGWKELSHDCAGEAGVAILFGCQLKNLNRGLQLASGWDGDRAALFEGSDGKRLLIWASSWDSGEAAARCARACYEERRAVHHAMLTGAGSEKSKAGNVSFQWQRPDGREGLVLRDGRHVIVVETDFPGALREAEAISAAISFTDPPEDNARAAMNSTFRRFNPFISWQRDGDYTVTRALGGLLSRHDRNSVGAADSFLFGWLGESRRTTSFHKWELANGWIARHQSEARRGASHTTLLPWGMLASHSSYRLPQLPNRTITRSTFLWGLGATVTFNASETRSVHLLPFGLLCHSMKGPTRSSFHIVGTGYSRARKTDNAAASTRFRILGIPVWTRRAHQETPGPSKPVKHMAQNENRVGR